jgi:hypothetical protein
VNGRGLDLLLHPAGRGKEALSTGAPWRFPLPLISDGSVNIRPGTSVECDTLHNHFHAGMQKSSLQNFLIFLKNLYALKTYQNLEGCMLPKQKSGDSASAHDEAVCACGPRKGCRIEAILGVDERGLAEYEFILLTKLGVFQIGSLGRRMRSSKTFPL